MIFAREVYLGNAEHTLYSDEKWYLVIPGEEQAPYIEGRFQTEAPDRTGYPTWSHAPCCIVCEKEAAVCRMPLETLPRPSSPNRFALVPDAIWQRVVVECERLSHQPPEPRSSVDVV